MTPQPSGVALIANGEIRCYHQTKILLSAFEKIIAIDGGLEHCEKMGVMPSLIVGDLDSVSEQTLKKYPQVPLLKYPQEKDESDLELAIKNLLAQGIQSMVLFGVLGKRVDHLLSTLCLLARYPTNLKIESEEETIFCLQKQNTLQVIPGQTLSLMPLNQVTGVNTQGLQWELKNAVLNKNFLSLSNICLTNSITINLQSGDLLCCLQKRLQQHR
jgi:thiamine pyrophosphokinase